MVTRVPVPVGDDAPPGQTAAYLLADGDLLVDPATRSPALTEAVAAAEPDHVAVTHHHRDHAGALAEYAAAFDLTVWARAGRAAAFESATGVDPDRTVVPGAEIPAGDGVSVLDAPGHAPEHVAFRAGDGLVTGDLAVADGSVAVAAPDGDLRAYLTSLRRVHATAPDRLYPAHGPVIQDPRATCERLLCHRLRRERRVLAAVRDGHAAPEHIVDAAYEKDVAAVRDLARATVVAHLEKLAVEGRVDWNGTRARV